MMPERQKPSAGRSDGEKRLCFPEAWPPPLMASARTLLVSMLSATFQVKGSERLCDSQEPQNLGWEGPAHWSWG